VIKAQTSDAPVVLSPATPQISAAKFKEAVYPTLVIYQNEWMDWSEGAYHGIEAETIEAAVSAFMGAAKVAGYQTVADQNGKKVQEPALFPFNPTPKHIADTYTMLRHACHVPVNTMDPPSWLEGTSDEYLQLNPKTLISFKNGLLDIETRALYPATSHFFTRTALEMEYDRDAPVPELWLQFLTQVTNGRGPLIDLVQEMLGYLLTCDTSMHKIFFLWGLPRSGKGTILRVTTALVGKGNMRFPTIETLAGRFGLQNLIAASVAQITDANTMNKIQLGTAANRMNGISGEDGQTVERKNIGDWNGKISARFQMAGNSLPNFGSNTAAMATRLLIIPFERSFKGSEDRRLTEKLIAELPGILNWCLVGLDRLRARGDFFEPADSAAAKKRLVHMSDPIHGFVEDCCSLKGGAGVDKHVLYSTYVEYCEELHAKVQSLGDFTEGLQAIHPTVRVSRRRKGENHQVRCYRNIRLNLETAFRVYQVEQESYDDLGLGEPLTVIKCDPSGWPVPRQGGDFSI
jgi:putative DNA primase/helicase